MAYKGAQPDDGWAYSKVELAGLWEMPVSINLVIMQREKRYAFFDHCAAKFNDPNDAAIVALLKRATVSEILNPEPDMADEPFAEEPDGA